MLIIIPLLYFAETIQATTAATASTATATTSQAGAAADECIYKWKCMKYNNNKNNNNDNNNHNLSFIKEPKEALRQDQSDD